MHRSRIIVLVAVIFLILPASPSYAQSTSGQATPAVKPQSPAIVTNVDEVTLDLVVHNKKNKAVLDLKPEDVAVTDDGSVVKLTDLRLVTGTATEHLVTLVFDRLDPSAAKNAHDIAAKILKMVPAEGFSFSVLSVGGRLRFLQGFTSDRVMLAKAIEAATERGAAIKNDAAELPEKNLISAAQTGTDSSGTRVSTKDRNAARIMLASLQESQRIVQDQHCMPSLASLLALARTQRQTAGRKVVIFFEQGPQLDSNARDMLRTIVGAANRSGVSIYSVDVNALDPNGREGLIATVAIGGARVGAPAAPTGPAAQIPQPYGPGMTTEVGEQYNRFENDGLSGASEPLGEMAISTGGAYILSSDNLKKPLHRMIEDMTTYYEASYVPPIQEFDGKFRPVAVRAMRKGLKIHSRAGYFALPPDAGSRIRPFEAPLIKVLNEPQLPSAVKFRSAILRLGDLATGNENELVVEIPVSELETRDDPNSNLYSLHVTILAQIKNKAGEVIEHFSEDIPRHASLDSKTNASTDLVTMQRHFLADPGEYVLETAVLDRNSQKAGAERTEFEIAGATTGPALSDVAIVQHLEPLPAEMDSTEPLRYGSSKVVPNLSGQSPRGAKNISFFFMVHPDPSSTEQARLEMEVLKNNEQIAQLPLQLRKTTEAGVIPYLASIQSGSLSSGNYEVIERLTQDGKTSEHAVTFRIEGPELASAVTPENPTGKAPGDETDVSSQPGAGTDTHSGRRLVITALPDGPALSDDQVAGIVASARKHALDYTASLPNFICVEVTNRSVDQSGKGYWKHRDSIAELLTYHEKQESRTMLEFNGKRTSLKRADLNSSWPMSVGEFGALLKLVFSPSSKTQFGWKEAATLGDGTGTMQVLTYHVAHENATIALSEGNDSIGVGFHGLVYIDGATSGIRRITLEADGLPRTFSMHAASMTVDYDYVAISGRDYLLPVRSTVSLQRGRRQIELNEIAFRNYRRFGSRTKIKMIQ